MSEKMGGYARNAWVPLTGISNSQHKCKFLIILVRKIFLHTIDKEFIKFFYSLLIYPTTSIYLE